MEFIDLFPLFFCPTCYIFKKKALRDTRLAPLC